MYRKPGSLGVLQGVLSGPYTGGTKRVDAAKLEPASRQRLADALAGRSEPSAICYERASDVGARFPAFWGLVVALVAYATLFAIGFGDLRSPRALQPASWLALYGAASVLFAGSLLVLLRRRALSSGRELAPGRYLLPLDLVDVPAADRHGRQMLSVTPLGDARDAIVRGAGRKRELVIVFEDSREARFPIRSDAAAEFALARLEHSQRLLEELTYVGEIDKAFSHDPLFDLRIDDSWDAVASLGRGTRSSVARGLFHGPLAWAGAALFAFGFAFGGLAARNRLSDRALWLRAVSIGSPEGFDAYLARGRSYRVEAEMMRDHLLAARDDAARASDPARDADARVIAIRSASDCLTYLEQHGAPLHPETKRIVQGLLEQARTSRDPVVPVTFSSRVEGRPADAPALDLKEREDHLVATFERIFSETCPANVLRFSRRAERSDHAGLDVRYVVTYPGVKWRRTPQQDPSEPAKKDIIAYGIAFTFDVTLRGPTKETAQFHLGMPSPHDPVVGLRDRSIYLEHAPAEARYARILDFDDRVYPAMTARAFDRLYDEIYTLFFDGDPRVPIPDDLAIEDWSKKSP